MEDYKNETIQVKILASSIEVARIKIKNQYTNVGYIHVLEAIKKDTI